MDVTTVATCCPRDFLSQLIRKKILLSNLFATGHGGHGATSVFSPSGNKQSSTERTDSCPRCSMALFCAWKQWHNTLSSQRSHQSASVLSGLELEL